MPIQHDKREGCSEEEKYQYSTCFTDEDTATAINTVMCVKDDSRSRVRRESDSERANAKKRST